MLTPIPAADRSPAVFWLVDQRSLHHCRLELEDQPLEPASLFPFFDQAGRTQAVMITLEQSSRILMLDWHPELFRRGWLGRHRLRARFTDLRDCELSDVERLAHLWHFDPWWVLAEDRYLVHSAVPILRRTNLPGSDESFTRLWFDRSLRRVQYLASGTASGTAESTTIRRFRESALQRAARQRQQAPALASHRDPARREWRLRPFWQ